MVPLSTALTHTTPTSILRKSRCATRLNACPPFQHFRTAVLNFQMYTTPQLCLSTPPICPQPQAETWASPAFSINRNTKGASFTVKNISWRQPSWPDQVDHAALINNFYTTAINNRNNNLIKISLAGSIKSEQCWIPPGFVTFLVVHSTVQRFFVLTFFFFYKLDRATTF